MKKKKVNHILWIILMSAMTVLMLIPIIMMLTTAVKPIEEIRSAVFHLLPRNFTWNNFKDAMNAGPGMCFSGTLCSSLWLLFCFPCCLILLRDMLLPRLRFRGF